MSINTETITSYYNSLNQSIDSIKTDSLLTDSDIEQKNLQLLEKQRRQLEQQKEIEEKNKLVLTRSRMLQLAQERNMYKKKIIYTMIAIIFFILILALSTYLFISKKTSNMK
jgi:predicted RND superfamily exporter protein